jgi:hypothetical protein
LTSRRNNDNDGNPNFMKTKIFFALTVAAGLAACRLQAQGTLSADATILETGTSGSEFQYSLTLTNTGSNPINAFWYGWTRGSFNLPSVPTSTSGPTGWTAVTSSFSVQFGNSTGSAIAPGATGTFTFETTNTPTQMTSGTHEGDPTGESVAYATTTAMTSFEQSVPGVASGPFTPAFNPGTLSAAATIIETGTSGSEFQYSLTLTNTGSNPINAFWYGWTQGSFNLPSVPTSIAGPTGWTATTSSDSVQFGNSTGSAIAPGSTGSFTFESTSDPAALTTGTHDGDPTGESVAYATVTAMTSFEQSVAGVASGPFTPTLGTAPPPPAPDFQPPALVDGSLQLSWTSVSGVAYQVQYSTDLSQTNWINLGSSITASASSTTTNDVIGSNSLRFYRVVVSP